MPKEIEAKQIFYKLNANDIECCECTRDAVVLTVCCREPYCEKCALDSDNGLKITKKGNIKFKCDDCDTDVIVRPDPKEPRSGDNQSY